MVKNLPDNEGDIRNMDSIPGLGRSKGEEMATYSSILAWKKLMDRGAGGLQSRALQKVGYD